MNEWTVLEESAPYTQKDWFKLLAYCDSKSDDNNVFVKVKPGYEYLVPDLEKDMARFTGKNMVISFGDEDLEPMATATYTTDTVLTSASNWAVGTAKIFTPNATGRVTKDGFVIKHSPGHINCKCSLEQEIPAKETKMKALYKFYALNRRTGVHLVKEVVGEGRKDKALSAILLENADEIKLTVGNPKDCVYILDAIFDFEPIEDESD